MFADDGAIEQEDRDVESMPALQGRIAIDVDYIDRGE